MFAVSLATCLCTCHAPLAPHCRPFSCHSYLLTFPNCASTSNDNGYWKSSSCLPLSPAKLKRQTTSFWPKHTHTHTQRVCQLFKSPAKYLATPKNTFPIVDFSDQNALAHPTQTAIRGGRMAISVCCHATISICNLQVHTLVEHYHLPPFGIALHLNPLDHRRASSLQISPPFQHSCVICCNCII